jgi:putative membrane protein
MNRTVASLAVAGTLVAVAGWSWPAWAVMTSADRTFVNKAAQGGVAEVALGQLAEKNAKSAQVKQFGARMVRDHGKANGQLKQLASKEGVSLPKTMSPEDQALHDKLTKLKGEAFDRTYMANMVQDHMKDVSDFKKAAATAKDPGVKKFASQTLPTLQQHLNLAKKVAKVETSPAHMKKPS